MVRGVLLGTSSNSGPVSNRGSLIRGFTKRTLMTAPMPHSEGTTQEFFRQLELRRTRALVNRDMATLNELHAPQYQLITPAGRVFDRERYLAAIASEAFYAAWEVGEMAFRVSPGMALVRYQACLTFPSGRQVRCWHTDAYENRAGVWQAVWSQATEIREAQAQW